MTIRFDGHGVTRQARGLAAAWSLLLAAASAAQAADLGAPVEDEPPPAASVAPDSRWSAAYASEVRYYSWTSDRGSPPNVNTNPGSGTQVYAPFALQLTSPPSELFKVELLGRGGWVHSRQTTFGVSGEVDTITDTVASGTVTYLGFDGIQPFTSLSLNIPTGKAALSGTEVNARMDPDLVEIGSFGEGWNIGPTLGFNLPISQSLLLTAAAGYTWRGEFDRENSLVALPSTTQSLAELDPGDVFTLTASLSYAKGPWSASILGTLSEETATTEDGAALYKAGRRYLVSASLGYSWPERFGVTTLTASLAESERNEVKFLDASPLVTEPFNTNSTVYRIGLEHLWPVGQLWFGPVASYLNRDRNAYDAGTLQFVPAKERYSAGLLASFATTDSVSFNLRAEHVWTREGERTAINGQMFSVLANGFVLSEPVPEIESTGWQLSGGLNVKF